MRQSNDEYRNGKLFNGYDYDNQAWVRDGVYVACGHPQAMGCKCYGRLHAGESCYGENKAKWFDDSGNLINEIPKQCIEDCSGPGQKDYLVSNWVNKLGFEVPREKAISYLKEYGAWDDLENDTDKVLAERVLWLACGDYYESGEYFGLNH